MSQRPSRRELRQLQDSQGAQQQQGNPNADTNALLQQLALIYGLQQEQQMAPEKMRALQLENQQRTYQNEQAPQVDAMHQRLGEANINHLQHESSDQFNPHDLAMIVSYFGNNALPSYLEPSMPQSYRDQQSQKAAAAEQQNAAMRDSFNKTGGPNEVYGPQMPTHGQEFKQGVQDLVAGGNVGLVDKAAKLTGPLTYPFRQLHQMWTTPANQPLKHLPMLPEYGNFWGNK